MIVFEVGDMSCSHCVGAITQAVEDVDRGARVDVDLASKKVRIEPVAADAQTLGDAIRAAGYTPVPA